ncbi:2-dehydro-3-deoxygluconokinase [Nocardioides terrae]|uniref:2-dehydro-3-deoxygluconokinase n=1 Tax=Nocardioides terrae TaxID=574651 RepID=A0A1I1IMV7_9ACTN|nr:sugar kinase [Nocardioides terrae]SFC34570.1 2-dehydro-3-deoxygluconokinase [Nocardioides terrae]
MNRDELRPGRLLAVGETMAVVTPTAGAVVDAELFHVDAGGAESNVAAHLSALGHRAAWFSRLGDDALGRRILRQLRARGVDVAAVGLDAGRPTGLYVKDPGNGVRYYRAGSAAAGLSLDDAGTVGLDGVSVLHVSGITAAISSSARGFLVALMERAHRAGVLVSFDVNHRPALWGVAEAGTVLADLARRADLVLVGRDEAETLWSTGTAAQVRARFPDVPELVVKDGDVGATAFVGGEEWFVPSLQVEVVDVVGAGDAFAAGYLGALLDGVAPAECLRAGHERAAVTIRTVGDSVDDLVTDPLGGPLSERPARPRRVEHPATGGP